MKKGVCEFCTPAEWPTKKLFTELKSAGFDAVELLLRESGGALSLDMDQAAARKLRAQADHSGIELTSVMGAFLWQHNLASGNRKVREQAVQHCARACEVLSWIGAKYLLVIPGVVGPLEGPGEIVNYEDAYQRSLEALHRCVPVAEKHKVTLCIENVWNKFLLSPLEMREFIDKLDSDCVGAYFDVGNILLTGFPEHWIKILGRRIRCVHFKDFKPVIGNINGFCDLLEGDVNWKAVMTELRALRYNGLCTVEVPVSKQSPEGCLRDWSSKLDQIFAM